MARKKLNKKVAIVGSLIFILFAMVAIVLFLKFGGNPQKFIKDGDAALKMAHEATDEQIKEEEYKKAEKSYLRARARTKDDSIRVEVLFKLADFYLERGDWNNVRGSWSEIIRVDSSNIKARFALLKYVYTMADSGITGAWKEVELEASELIEIAIEQDLLDEEISQWDVPEIEQEKYTTQKLGPYLYLCRGKANLGITKSGALTNPEQVLTQAGEDLEKVQQLQADNILTCFYIAQAEIAKGNIYASRGDFEERDRTLEQAKKILTQAVEIAPDDPAAHINLLKMKLSLVTNESFDKAKQEFLAFEPECLSLVERFDSSAEAFATLVSFYRHPILGVKYIDKAIGAIEKAIELDRENISYAIVAANLYYNKFSIYGDTQNIYKAIEIAQNTLTLSGAQDQPGPRQAATKRNRNILYNFLANYYIQQVLEPAQDSTQEQTQQWLTKAEQVVHEIEQLVGSGEDPQVVKWQGMLELAKGNRDLAIQKLYATYEQLNASGKSDGQIAYTLAKIYKNSSETGAVLQFLTNALNANIDLTKPESRLEYVETLLKLKVNAWAPALANIDSYEQKFGPSKKSQGLRIVTYIGESRFDEAQQELDKMSRDDPNMISLNMELMRAKIVQLIKVMTQKRVAEKQDLGTTQEDQLMEAELKGYQDTMAELAVKLLALKPDLVPSPFIVDICNAYIKEGNIVSAKELINKFLEHFPDNIDGLLYRQMLSEPDPANISQQRRKEIKKIALINITDPTRRALSLGVFHYENSEPNQAVVELKKVIDIDALSKRDDLEQSEEKLTETQMLATGYLMNIALSKKDWQLASGIIKIAQQKNIDGCGGKFFNARLIIAKEQYQDAIAELDECLKEKPVFSQAYMVRSNVNAILKNDDAAVEDARKAVSLNPTDGNIAKVFAFALYRRNQKLGEDLSSDQATETKVALLNAIAKNPSDMQLSSFYAEFISQEKPDNALAMRQRLLRAVPTVENALLLGNMAMRMAREQFVEIQKEALYAIAASAYEQARAIDPQSISVISSLAEYYRITGQQEQAKQLLEESNNESLLWVHYYRSGRFADAREVLTQLYQKQPDSPDVLKGFLLIAEKTANKENAQKYSKELLVVEDTTENNLFQIQIFLKIGLVKEAEYRLQSFREKYPNEPKAMLFEAWLSMKQGRLENALELTNKSLQYDQDDPVAWKLRGQVNRFLTNYDQAITDLKKSKTLLDDPLTRVALAKAYLRTKQDDYAITELKNAIDHPQAPAGAMIVLEDAYWRLGRRLELKRFYDEALKKSPDDIIWLNKAANFAMAERDLPRAEKLFGTAWRKGRSDTDSAAEALNGYLRALMLAGKDDQVVAETQELVNSEFAPVAFIWMARIKKKLGDRETAIKYCRKAVDKAGTNETFASWAMQQAYTMLGADEILKYCKERLQQDPDSITANLTMYNLSRIDGQYNKALDHIEKCLQVVAPDSPENVDYAAKKAAVLQLAYNKTSDNNYLNQAIAEYESLLAKVPNNIGVLNNLAYMLAENDQKLPEALKYGERIYQTSPDVPGVLDTYAYVLYKNEEYEKASEIIQSALQQYEQGRATVPAEVYEHLGMIKEKLGVTDQATEAYRQALEVGADTLPKPVIERIKKAVERLSSQ